MLPNDNLPEPLIVNAQGEEPSTAEDTPRGRLIAVLLGNFTALFRHRADVLVGGMQFWYPDEGEPDVRAAPDVYVVFGRPKGERSSYRQWEEGGVPLTVAFDVGSPGEDVMDMLDKFDICREYGVEEYYYYDPANNDLSIYVRQGQRLRRHKQVEGFVSPRLGIRFELSGPQMSVYRPDGRPFLSVDELAVERAQGR
jgi:Uma2 family endonuclease